MSDVDPAAAPRDRIGTAARWVPAAALVAVAIGLGLWFAAAVRPEPTTIDLGDRPAVRLGVGRYEERSYLDVVWRDDARVGPAENLDTAGLGVSFHLGPTTLADRTIRDEDFTATPAVGLQVQAPTRAVGLAAALMLVAGLIAASHARRPRRDPGVCPGCGYDLRVLPRRCPECAMPRDDALGSTVAHG